jgi:hypothetical protein
MPVGQAKATPMPERLETVNGGQSCSEKRNAHELHAI